MKAVGGRELGEGGSIRYRPTISWDPEPKKNRRAFQVSRGAPERGARYSRGQCSAHPFRFHQRNFGAVPLIQRVSPGRDSVRDGASEHDFRKSFWGQWPTHGHHLIDDHDESTHDECGALSVL